MKEKISFYFYRFSMIFTIFALLFYLNQWVNSENSKSSGWVILILVGFTLLCYFSSRSDSKKHQEDKMEAVSSFIKEPDINIETIEVLVREIERYNKKMKTFAVWIAGLSATFIILLATIATNSFMKIFDVYLKVVPTDELSKMLENVNQSGYMNDTILNYLNLGLVLLFIFLIVILIIYNAFVILTFVKEQILIFLFDVKYKLLSDDIRESKSEVDEAPSENI